MVGILLAQVSPDLDSSAFESCLHEFVICCRVDSEPPSRPCQRHRDVDVGGELHDGFGRGPSENRQWFIGSAQLIQATDLLGVHPRLHEATGCLRSRDGHRVKGVCLSGSFEDVKPADSPVRHVEVSGPVKERSSGRTIGESPDAGEDKWNASGCGCGAVALGG